MWPDYPAAGKIVSAQAAHRAGEALLIWVRGGGVIPGEIFPLPKLPSVGLSGVPFDPHLPLRPAFVSSGLASPSHWETGYGGLP